MLQVPTCLGRACVIQSCYSGNNLAMDDGSATSMQAFHKICALRGGVGVFATQMELLLLPVLIIVDIFSLLLRVKQ
jgi:hypothetical protein